jgi:HlyD family secretion protein
MGEFREYYPFDATVVPETSVYLDVEEGGRVEEIHMEGGQYVEKGDLILSISNTSLQRTSIDTETSLLENLDRVRNTQFNVAQSTIQLKEALLDMDYYILDLEKRQKRYEALMRSDSLAKQEFEAVEDELEYRRDKRELMIERIRQEDLLNAQQLAQAETSIVRLNRSLDLLTQIVDSLEVRAPISGHLSSIDAEIGQSIGRGQRIGQIDILDQFKIRVEIDQYYVSRIGVGTEGRFRVDQQDYPVVVRKIDPEVTDNYFSVDADFVGEVPTSIRR